jgi:hypothetical protein
MLNEPFRLVRTEIAYAKIQLGGGSDFVSPVTSELRTFLPNQDENACARKFNTWHKFHVNTQILMDATQ